MEIFLTSLPYGVYRGGLTEYYGFNPENGFADRLEKAWRPDSMVLFIASQPDDYEMVDGICYELKHRLTYAGLTFSGITALDHRTSSDIIKDMSVYDAVFLSGGHVPTTNDFYHEIGLKERIKSFDGVLVGISSGSMNSASEVYAQPEMEGESAPDFVRFREGLGLVDISIIPHYEAIKDDILDGKRLFEDITYKDSMGKTFYLLNDGSYVTKEDGRTVIHGTARMLKDGIISVISGTDEEYII